MSLDIITAITPLRNAQTEYNQKQQEEAEAKAAFESAKNTVDILETALAEANDAQTTARLKEDKAKNLSYDEAFVNGITDPDFAYLNDEISKVKDAQSREALLQEAYNTAVQKAAECEKIYEQTKLDQVRTLAELAVAQTTYDNYLADKKAEEAIWQAKADEESKKETEKMRQVFEQKAAADKYDNQAAEQKIKSVKTGDIANVGGLMSVIGASGIIAVLAQKIKRREQD